MANISETLSALTADERRKFFSYLAPLSAMQRRLWVLQQLDPGSNAYNVPFARLLRGEFDVAAMAHALDTIVERHEILRTVFVEHNDNVFQIVLDPSPVISGVVQMDSADWDGTAAGIAQLSWVGEQALAPFDLSEHPPMRAVLFQLTTHEYILIVVFHHIAVDGWSLKLFESELRCIYDARTKGEQAVLPTPIQYSSFARWQQAFLSAERIAQQLEYWTGRLKVPFPTKAIRPTRSVATCARPAVDTFAIDIDSATITGLERLASAHGCTMFMVLLAALHGFIRRLSGESGALIGTSTFNRKRPQFEAMIGFCVNTLVLPVDTDGDPNFEELVARARQAVLDAFSHDDLPFDLLVEELRLSGQRGRDIFNVSLEYQIHSADVTKGLCDVAIEPISFSAKDPKFDLGFFFVQYATRLRLTLEFNDAAFDQNSARTLGRGLVALLDCISQSPSLPLSELTLLDQTGVALTLRLGEGEKLEWAQPSVLVQLGECARVGGSRIAVRDEQSALGFNDLYAKAVCIGAALSRAGVQPGDFVGVVADRTVAQIIAICGIWAAGAAYVPIDPKSSSERKAFIVTDARLRLVIGRDRSFGVRYAPIDLASIEELDSESFSPQHATHDAPAYAIYTSGTTGVPKAAVVSHGSLLNLQSGLLRRFGIEDAIGEVATLNAPLVFDASLQQIVLMLAGAQLYIVPEAVRIDGEGFVLSLVDAAATILDCTPSHLRLLLDAGLLNERTPLRRVLVGGEAIAPDLWSILAQVEEIAFFNMYGPTECAVDTTCHQIALGDLRPVIGIPLPNVSCRVVDEKLRLLPVGGIGELLIAGAGVALGYLERSDLTTKQFIDWRAAESAPVERAYRTGDFVRLLDCGVIEFVGRRDDQLKIRGLRVELGEIEARLATCAGVREAVVVPMPTVDGTTALAGFYIAQVNGLTAGRLRQYLTSLLPSYMVPDCLVAVESIPLTMNGKIDRSRLLTQLPVAPLTEPDRSNASPPEDGAVLPSEKIVLEIWRKLLGRGIGPNDDFFMAGGHSLLAARMTQQVRKALGVNLQPGAVFSAPTARGFARQCMRMGSDVVVTLMSGSAETPPLICAHALGGDVFAYRGLVRGFDGAERPILGLQISNAHATGAFAGDVDSMLQAYTSALLSRRELRACHLLGWSMGGLVAMGVAHQLEQAGVAVLSVSLWDCGLSPTARERPRYPDPAIGFHSLLNTLRAGDPAIACLSRDLIRSELDRYPPQRHARWFLDWVRTKTGIELSVDPDVLERLVAVTSYHYWLFSAYVPNVVDAPLRVVWAKDSLDNKRITRTNWKPYTNGDLTESVVQATHHTIVNPPTVDALARDTLEFLSQREQAGSTRASTV